MLQGTRDKLSSIYSMEVDEIFHEFNLYIVRGILPQSLLMSLLSSRRSHLQIYTCIAINYASCDVCRNTSNDNYVISYDYVHLHDEIQQTRKIPVTDPRYGVWFVRHK